ncbi:MAG: YfcE family phosphodiesterase [Pirellulales bacterium]|nr:YfcE family phosphodiesterase [Pirellulales bacterium]
MRLGIISDTHGQVDLARYAVRMLESLEVETVLHCGDIGSIAVAELFAPWPTHFVLGNCDDISPAFAEAIRQTGQTCHGQFGDLVFEGVRVALLHSHDRRRFRQAIEQGEYGLVCYGHTHIAAIDHHGGTIVLNPGAIYRADPPSLAVIDLPSLEATIVKLG